MARIAFLASCGCYVASCMLYNGPYAIVRFQIPHTRAVNGRGGGEWLVVLNECFW